MMDGRMGVTRTDLVDHLLGLCLVAYAPRLLTHVFLLLKIGRYRLVLILDVLHRGVKHLVVFHLDSVGTVLQGLVTARVQLHHPQGRVVMLILVKWEVTIGSLPLSI